MRRPRVQVLLDDAPLSPAVRRALQAIDADVEVNHLDAVPALRAGMGADARLVLTSHDHRITNGTRERLLRWCSADPCATLVLSGSPPAAETGDGLPSVVSIEFADAMTTDHLAGRLTALCSVRPAFDAFRKELESVRQSEQLNRAALRRLADELRQAGDLQRDLHAIRPMIHGAELYSFHCPAGTVGGDVTEVVRLDESHVGITLADATGHDVAAALLAAFLKRSLRGEERFDGRRHLLEPNEVLARANADLLAMDLPDCQFATALYAVFEETRKTVRFARAGAPYPIVVRDGQPPRRLHGAGPLLGALPTPGFEVVDVALRPGDTLLLHTDGLDALLRTDATGSGVCDVLHTTWCQSISREPLAGLFAQLQERSTSAEACRGLSDDVSALALHLRP